MWGIRKEKITKNRSNLSVSSSIAKGFITLAKEISGRLLGFDEIQLVCIKSQRQLLEHLITGRLQ